MLSLYVFSLVLGGGFLLLSLLSGEGGDADLGAGVELDGPLEVDGGDLDVSPDADATPAAAKIFSFRGLIYALFGFGATGTILTPLGVGSLASAAAAVVTGFASNLLVTGVFNYLRRTESGARPGDESFTGAVGRVTLPLHADAPGAVVVERGGREIRLRALPHPSATGQPGAWRRIMVVEMSEGVARVVPLEEENLLES